MVCSEVYLNKYVISIAPFSTPAFTPAQLRKLLFFACFRFLIFHQFFQGVSADPICPYVRTPVGGQKISIDSRRRRSAANAGSVTLTADV